MKNLCGKYLKQKGQQRKENVKKGQLFTVLKWPRNTKNDNGKNFGCYDKEVAISGRIEFRDFNNLKRCKYK